MKTIKPKTTYEALDGRKFTDPIAAKLYEELEAAKRRYESARFELGKLLAESFKTADGLPFKLGLWPNYYWIAPGWFSMPNLLTVSFWGTNWGWEENDNATTLVLISNMDDQGKHLDHSRQFPIDELYSDETRAKRALIAAQEKWLAERAAEVAEQKTKL